MSLLEKYFSVLLNYFLEAKFNNLENYRRYFSVIFHSLKQFWRFMRMCEVYTSFNNKGYSDHVNKLHGCTHKRIK